MVRRVKISEEDIKNLSGHILENEKITTSEFKGLVVNKPWGYEYLMFENERVAIWMLYIKKGYSTSVHCHPKKKTSLLVVLGEVITSTLNERFNLKEKEGIIYDKGVFHTTEPTSEKGAFIMEIETPVDKTDLFRLKDKYNREHEGYTSKGNVTNKTYNYHYKFINENNGETSVLGKHKISVKEYENKKELLNSLEIIKPDMSIIVSGNIFDGEKCFFEGDLIDLDSLKRGQISGDNGKVKLLFLHEKKNLVKLSDFVISFLQSRGINNAFLVSGGNLMYLLESIRIKKMNYVCNHHEQASAMAAEGYSKLTNKPGFCMVTSGPGGTNAVTGAAGAWIDSNPVIFISGQSYSTQTIKKTGLRQLGVQEINIVDMVKPITKFAVMVEDSKKIKYYLEKALYLASSGRPGPVWIDIPVNIQLEMVEVDELESFIPPSEENFSKEKINEKIKEVIWYIKNSKRPVILLGNGVRLGDAEKEFLELAERLSIPVLTTRNANDLIWDNHPLYSGRVGSFGQRAANFAIQNSDLMLSIGSRVALAVTGWAYNDFAREAKKIVVDIDEAELNKSTIKPDLKINCDAKTFILEMIKQTENFSPENYDEWKTKIKNWREKYPIVLEEYKSPKGQVNTYHFSELLSEEVDKGDVVLTDMGMSFQCVMQAFKIKKGVRLFTSAGLAAMGFGLPGTIGACIGNNKNRTICVTGDGGLMMNIQELQTIKHNNLPIKIFIFNNNGYSSIRETQRAYFEGLLGAEKDSGVSMPDFIKVAESFGLKTKKITNQENLREDIKEVLNYDGPIVCDMDISEDQLVIPKQGAFNRPDGKTVPRPIEDSIPYLDRDEFNQEMIIDPIFFDPYKLE